MTEYELATLALRTHTLWVTSAQVLIAALVGAGQIAIVWYGIRAMREASTTRSDEQDLRHTEAMRKLDDERAASERRHTETMRALEALISQRSSRPA